MPITPAQPGRRYREAIVRFYFDADVLGLAHVIGRLRPDIGEDGPFVYVATRTTFRSVDLS